MNLSYKKLGIFILLLCFVLVGCTSDPIKQGEDKSILEPDPDSNPIVKNDVLPNENLYESFFLLDSKLHFEIDIEDSELALIQQDYENYSKMGSKSPIYRKCNLTVSFLGNNYYLEEVGIRMKGNTSLTSFYSSNEGINSLIHFKLSFSQTFDNEYYDNPKEWASDEERKARKERTFLGMEKLDLKWNKSCDETYVREYYTYNMFREFGVIAPHSTIGQVKIKNKGKMESLGVFIVLENVDEIFINRYIDENDQGGNLYKCGWGTANGADLTTTNNAIGIEDEDKVYFPTYDLKTNKKKANHQPLVNLIDTLNNNDVSKLDDIIDSLIDIDNFIAFQAVSYFLGNPDDMRNHYNNYYIYFKKTNNQAIFIPYDYDRTLGVTKDWNPTGNGMVNVTPFSRFETCTNKEEQMNPLINKTIVIGGNNRLIKLYNEKIKFIFNSSYFTNDKIQSLYRTACDYYGVYIKPTISKVEDQYVRFAFDISNTGNLVINNYINKKRETTNKNLLK